ncbi:hypothetical protein X943_000276 [Babesia divergens]|uniref:Uncharacterized protein n=1 Tax=Babesia divergens TaxID=32595 RepID=A0AAD9GCB2_BABDI|nr:hypothetical protein X943_000276 [Babesia divergens]
MFQGFTDPWNIFHKPFNVVLEHLRLQGVLVGTIKKVAGPEVVSVGSGIVRDSQAGLLKAVIKVFNEPSTKCIRPDFLTELLKEEDCTGQM